VSSANVPDVNTLARATAELLLAGPAQSDSMRRRLAGAYGIAPDGSTWPRFVNNHAWALVRLQASGTIRKISAGWYERLAAKPDLLRSTASPPISDDPQAPLPRWAREMVVRAAWKNRRRWNEAPFTESDLRAVWQRCNGCCQPTGMAFLETKVGTGRARRPYAPSLDRIDPERPYTRENCRLVLQAVNFALNAWGDEVFALITEAAVKHRAKGA
jgi:hypothetical protein